MSKPKCNKNLLNLRSKAVKFITKYKNKLNADDVIVTAEKVAYRGFFKIKQFVLKHKLFDGGLSREIQRELFCRGSAVGVLLYDPDTQLIGLVQQFRIGCFDNVSGPWVWEVIAGINDKQESAEEIALREVQEESGIALTETSLVPICEYYASPGGSDERLQLFCGITSLDSTEGVFGLEEEAEDILFKTFHYDDVMAMLQSGEINNAATIIALQWLQINRHLI